MKLINFHGMISFDSVLIDELRNFLQQRELELCRSIIYAIHVLPSEFSSPILAVNIEDDFKLSDAVEIFSKHIHKLGASRAQAIELGDWKGVTKQINQALWAYVEILGGGVSELFQQLKLVGFEQWNSDFMQAVDTIRGLLQVRIEEAGWKIRRLEALLWEYRWICERQNGKSVFFRRLFSFWRSLLDSQLLSHLNRSGKYLRFHYSRFSKQYFDCLKLKVKSDHSVKKFNGYSVFNSLDEGFQESFKKIYSLLKLWELNRSSKALPARQLVNALKNAYSIEKTTSLFKGYLTALQHALFEQSRKFKHDSSELYLDSSHTRMVGDVIRGMRAEVHTLGVIITKYREFFLQTHSNPYVRARWGFSDWMVASEPSQTKELISSIYEVELLDKLFDELGCALNKGPIAYNHINLEQHADEIENTLHEMGQPLSPYGVMKLRAEKLLSQIAAIDELGSFNHEAVDYVGKYFSRAIRLDWQYHVLFEIPLFHQMYSIHQGIVGEMADRNHLNRINKFKKLIEEIEKWVKNRTIHRHLHEIELDMSDMMGYLQDFLACTQRVFSEDDILEADLKIHVETIARQLLEYRYLFGQFFYFLNQQGSEGKQIRTQFLFVDQYFESVESLVHEIQSIWNTP